MILIDVCKLISRPARQQRVCQCHKTDNLSPHSAMTAPPRFAVNIGAVMVESLTSFAKKAQKMLHDSIIVPNTGKNN
jgi:hypothetical protein